MTARRAVRAAGVALSAALVTGCVPQLPSGYNVDGATGERRANSADQVKDGIKELAKRTSAAEAIGVTLPTELTTVPVPENAIARRYDRKQRNKDFCTSWLGGEVGSRVLQTPSLDDPEDLRKDAEVVFTSLHSIDPEKRYVDVSVRVKRGATNKRRLPTGIKAALPELEQHLHAWYARMMFVEELDEAGKLSAQARRVLVQRGLDEITGPEATTLMTTVNDFFTVHCLGGAA